MPDPTPTPRPQRFFIAFLQLVVILGTIVGGFALFDAYGSPVDEDALDHREKLARSVASFFGVFGLVGGASYGVLWVWRTVTSLAPDFVREFPRRILDDGPAKVALTVAGTVALATSIIVKADGLEEEVASLSTEVRSLVTAVDRAQVSQNELALVLREIDPDKLDLQPLLAAIDATNGNLATASTELRRELAGVRTAMGTVHAELDETQAGLRDAKDAVAGLDRQIEEAVEVADALPNVEQLVTDLQEIAVYEHRRGFGERVRDIWDGAPADAFPAVTSTSDPEGAGDGPAVASAPPSVGAER